MVSEVVVDFESELQVATVPRQAAVFKRSFGDALARFEAARIASPRRVEIARALVEKTSQACQFLEGARRISMSNALQREDVSVALESSSGAQDSGLRAQVPFEGAMFEGAALRALVDRLHREHHLTDAAREGLHWIVSYIDEQGGSLDLRGHKFAVLGAAAELSPAELLLRAGASVLWVDLQPPPTPEAGTLVYAPNANDLLREPHAVARSIRAFAAGEKVHVGMFAYAPGKGRELRLAESMNAIVEHLGKEVVRSVSLFVSPTSPGEMQPEDIEVMTARKHAAPTWQRALALSGLVRGPGHYGEASHAVARAVISLQGATYQAAQYLSKILRAELFAHQGMVVSANVAGISRTKSLEHPLFLAAFEGAPAFGVRIFEAATTRALGTLLMLSDLLRPRTDKEPRQRAKDVHSAQIHGGVYDLPWQFEAAVRAAAVLGAARRPRVLFRR